MKENEECVVAGIRKIFAEMGSSLLSLGDEISQAVKDATQQPKEFHERRTSDLNLETYLIPLLMRTSRP